MIPGVGTPSGSYTNEFTASTVPNNAVDPSKLPDRPFLGTELYYEGTGADSAQEQAWFQALGFDFVRVEVDAQDVITSTDYHSLLPSDFTAWSAADFEQGKGWHFNDPDTLLTNILQNRYGVKFPLMMMTTTGAESILGQIPNSADFADYFLATVYYYNVIQNQNIKYWEVLNEPDWGCGNPLQRCSPQDYADIFQRVAERIKNFPDPRVNSIALGGPVLGSGDPTDGHWPDGYPNRDSDGERQFRQYVPTLLAQGLSDGQHDVGFLSWHIYGSDGWGRPNNLYELNQQYAIVNEIGAYDKAARTYTGTSAGLPLIISEMNFAAGETTAASKAYYKNFYAALWYTSALNNVFSTGRVSLLSHFFWKGDNHWPKGLVYEDTDSNNQLVRTTAWWAYEEYLQHTQSKILAAYNGRINPWADAIVTTDSAGQMAYLIADNKADTPTTIDFSFDVPPALNGPVVISKRIMAKNGNGQFGEAFAEPATQDVYQFQSVVLDTGMQMRYIETIPPRTIVYYTLIGRSGTP